MRQILEELPKLERLVSEQLAARPGVQLAQLARRRGQLLLQRSELVRRGTGACWVRP